MLATPIPIAQPDLSGKELKYVIEAVSSGWLTHRGKYEGLFQEAFSKYVGRPAIATSSGTGALHIALMALGIGPGDEVIVPNLTFAAPASAVLAVGASVKLVDVNEKLCLDWEKTARAIGPKTRAIIPVHLFGMDADVQQGAGLNVPFIEDSCEALGYVKPQGTYACFSFYGNKVITTGEGGMLVGDFLSSAQKYRDGGFDATYCQSVPGLNYRMTNLQAAVGLAQMEHIEDILAKRQKSLEILSQLGGIGKWLYVVRTSNPVGLASYLKIHGVDTRPMFYPLHSMAPYRQLGEFTNTTWWWRNSLCLPVPLKEEQATYIVERVNEYTNLCRAGCGSANVVASC